MKITEQMISIPPYLSTRWENILSISLIQKEGYVLSVSLRNSPPVLIPDLSKELIDAIFDMHAKYLETRGDNSLTPPPNAIPFKIGGIGVAGVESLGGAMQHNPEQMHAPDMPKEILAKIVSITKILGMDDPNNLPKAEPHCNCMHCQIARAMQTGAGIPEENLDEEVPDEELTFRTWDIKQTSDKLYLVSNPLDPKEEYNVFLGEPIGCTCGSKDCEHIKAVLSS